MPAPKLGTGHGEREYSYVGHTEFRRMQPEPDEVIRIRYDSLDNLTGHGHRHATSSHAAGTEPISRFAGAQLRARSPGMTLHTCHDAMNDGRGRE